jgi:hypothetical protein
MSRSEDGALNWYQRATVEARAVLRASDTPLNLTEPIQTLRQSGSQDTRAFSDGLSLTFMMKATERDGA